MSKRWQAILNRLPTNIQLLGAEIGVFKGENSYHLLNERKKLYLYCIDPWKADMYPTSSCDSKKSLCQTEWDKNAKCAKKLILGIAKNRAIILRMTSTEAAKQIANSTLDFVFIDSIHDEAHVMEDLNIWFPKLKVNGFLCGHDYHKKGKGFKKFGGVSIGVNKWAIDHNMEIELDVDATYFLVPK
jgi:hypothetical protein